MSEARKKRLSHDEKMPIHQLDGAIVLREHTPSKKGKWFQRLLKFFKRVALFSDWVEALRSFQL